MMCRVVRRMTALGLLSLVLSQSIAQEFRVAGYLPDYRAANYDLNRCAGLTDLILFSAEPTADGGINSERLSLIPWRTIQRFKTEHRIRLFLTIGGWNRSAHFAPIATNENLCRRFAREASQLCLRYRLDGIDVDWEHPVTDAEVQGYGRLLCELRKSLDEYGLLLSVTMAAWQSVPARGVDAVHWVNVMSYDHDGEHSTLEATSADIQKLRTSGVSSSKMTLGLPFYGRDVQDRNKTMTYAEIVETFRPNDDADLAATIYFNGPQTIRRKVQLARRETLAGVMVWELGQDSAGTNSLLRHALDEAKLR